MKGLLFTYALTYGGAAASLYKPYYGFLVYVCFSILKPEALWHWSVPRGNYSRTVALALLVGWALNGFGNWSFGRARGVVLALLAFWGWFILQALIGGRFDQDWYLAEQLSKTFLPFLVGVTLIDSIEKIKQLAWVIVLSQGYLALELNLTYYNTVFLSEEFSFAGLDNNGIAITMVTCMGVALFLALDAVGWWRKAIAAACALFMAHVVLFSMSRGGMLAMVITCAGTFLLIPKRPIHYAGLTVAVLIILRLAGPQVQEEFLSAFKPKDELDASAASRWGLTAACISLMQEYPLMGVGINRFGEHVEKFGYWRGKEAHNTWGSMGAELGIPGLGFLATFYLLGMYRLWWLARDKSGAYDPWFATFARIILCSMTGFIVSATFVTVEGVETPYYIMAIGAGALKLHSNTLPLPRMLPYATLDARHLPRETQLAGSAATAG